MGALGVIRDTIRTNWRGLLGMTLGFVVLYYLTLLAIVIVRIGHLPNYVTFYNWPADILNIVRSTPSVGDMLPIIGNEWIFETGYKNYSYGHGIAEWSLAIIPPKVVVVALLGTLSTLSVLLLRRSRNYCHARTQGAGAAAAGLGSLLVAMTNVTLFWVSCCSTATWVVGLSLLGLETTTAYVLLPYGTDLSVVGFALLLSTIYALARRCVPRPPGRRAAAPPRLAAQIPQGRS
ncbi:MAG TPA: hypothetical protein VNG52_05335 [Stellaceae bacterium]|nr:hypothetical protein [Stellaceae bacterium]